MRNRRGNDWDRQQPSQDLMGRELPRHLEAEASVLGGVILKNEALAYIDTTEVEDFYDNRHKVVFQAMRNLEAAGRPIDVVTLEDEITKAGKIQAIGGVGFLGELTMRVPTVDNVEEYARILTNKRITRDVMLMMGAVLEEAYNDQVEGEQLVHDVTTALLSIGTGSVRPIETMASLIADEVVRIERDMEAKFAGKQVVSGIPTGITLIDHNVGGHPIGPPTLYIGRPGFGKTTILMQVNKAANLAGEPSMLASYEDRPQSFAQRGLAQVSGVSTDLIRARRLSPDDVAAIIAAGVAAAGRLEMVIAAAGVTSEALVRRVKRENLQRRSKGKKPLRQLIVDFIQKMPLPEWARSKDDGVGHNSQVLSTSAIDEDMALVVACQLNREVEKRDDHVPRLSDIRDCGSLDADGKFVVGMYYPHHYEPNKFRVDDLKLVIIKNHNGSAGVIIDTYWDKERHAIYNTATEYGAARNAISSLPASSRSEQTSMGDEFARRFDEAGDWHMR